MLKIESAVFYTKTFCCFFCSLVGPSTLKIDDFSETMFSYSREVATLIIISSLLVISRSSSSSILRVDAICGAVSGGITCEGDEGIWPDENLMLLLSPS